MSKISDGINQESKKLMLERLEIKKQHLEEVKKNIKERAQKIVNDKELTSYWTNAYVIQILEWNQELVKTEKEISLLSTFSK
ncbi:hypothetical protein SFC65_19485 [Priestia filamentosa]|uniref:hypothetical protein n=1 Tax=Priestia filamentosa TaxID=1402861 RepID=UPI0039823E3D